MSFPDISPEAALPRHIGASGSQSTTPPYRDGSPQAAVAEVNHDYTEGATQKEIEEVMRQHEAEEVAHIGEGSTGMGDEGPNDGKSRLTLWVAALSICSSKFPFSLCRNYACYLRWTGCVQCTKISCVNPLHGSRSTKLNQQ
jgi:hypothetical protein